MTSVRITMNCPLCMHYKPFPHAAAVVLLFNTFDSTVYDVGCGDGRVLIQMASRSVPFISDGDDDTTNCCGDDKPTNNNNNSTILPSPQQQQQQSSSTQHHYCKQFIGIEISPERTQEARSNIQHAQNTNQIPSHVTIQIICANALDTDTIDYSRATVIFLYLVPRGLRLIKPIVWHPKEDEGEGESDNNNNNNNEESQTSASSELRIQQSNNKCRRIITYMSPFEDEDYFRKELCHVDHQVGAAWPVYLYHVK